MQKATSRFAELYPNTRAKSAPTLAVVPTPQGRPRRPGVPRNASGRIREETVAERHAWMARFFERLEAKGTP
jgi:hypothetical protein